MNRRERRIKERQDAATNKQYPDFPEYKLYVREVLNGSGKRELKTFQEWRAWRAIEENLKQVNDG
jgi:hypothetical protein